MWKKTFIRSTLLLMVALAGLFVFATTHPSDSSADRECSQEKESCKSKTQSNEFQIWESLSRAIANAQF